MQSRRYELLWIPEAVSKLMADNGIEDRADLVRVLGTDIGQTTVYRAFDSRWQGKVTIKILLALSYWTGIPLAQLAATIVHDPSRPERRRVKKGAAS